MRKYLIFIVAMLLAVVSVLGGCEGGCGNNGSKDNANNNDSSEKQEIVINETEYVFVKDSASDYTIVCSQENKDNTYISFAIDELKNFTKEASKATLQVKTDNEVTYSEESKFIVVGDTSFSKDLISSEGNNYSGYKIKRINQSVFIVGGSGNGVLQGVYAFLHYTFNYKFYAADEYSIDSVSSKSILDFDIVHNPAIPIVQASYLSQESNIQYIRRSGMLSKYDIWMMAGSSSEGWTHNTMLWAREAIAWLVDNKKIDPVDDVDNAIVKMGWTQGSKELCFTRDNGDNNDLMFQGIVGAMENHIIEDNSGKVFLSLTQQDTNSWCHCQKCQAMKAVYNSNLAIMIKYANRVIDAINLFKKENNITKEVVLGIFAYQETEDPPVVPDGQGGYKPVSDDVVCHDGVMIEFAPLRMNMIQSFKNSANISYSTKIIQLHAITKNIGIWWYGTYFHTLLIPLNNFECMQETIQFFVENDVYWSFWEGQATNGSCCFEALRLFLSSKLHDDPYQDYNALIDEFFDAYYKDAASSVRLYFEEWRQESTINRDKPTNALSGDVGAENGKKDFFSYSSLSKWLNYIEGAYASIEHYKETDIALYNKLYDRICRESVSIRWLILKIYPAYFDDTVKIEMQKQFKKDCMRLGIVKDGGNLSDLYASWGI